MRLFFVLLITFLATGSVERAYGKAAVDAAVAAARAHVAAKERAIVDDFRALLALPNVSTNLGDMARNADWIEARLAARDFSYERVSAGNAPYILAERTFPGAERTLLIYAHFDGQPVDPSEWATPPFTPTLRAGSLENDAAIVPWADAPARLDPEWRIYGRSAGDDKAPVIAVFAALDALAAAGITPSVNVKLILMGRRSSVRRRLPGSLQSTRTSSTQTSCCSATAPCTSPAAVSSSLACAGARRSNSRPMGRIGRSTPGTTAAGRRTRTRRSCASSPDCMTRRAMS